MPATVKCPDPETLRQLLIGALPTESREHWEQHLATCDRCAGTANTIVASDDLTEAIRKRRVISGDENIVAELIEEGKQLRRSESIDQTSPTSLDETHDPSAGASYQLNVDPNDQISFLSAPELPDEIGRLGGYRVLKVLGAGGMGVVFQAEDPKLERLVALKAMKPSIAASRTAKGRFLREAKSTAAIDHHHIVQIYQVGEDNGVPFIAMQYLQGESLKSRIDRDGKLSQQDVLKIGAEVAEGLQAAHDTGLIHRDIKPDNIWIDEKTGWAKILDFGLVRAASDDAGLTHSGMIMGTPRYMSPEQTQGSDVGPASNLFSLGSVLYHLASGQPPFAGGNLTATLIAVATADPANLGQVEPELNTGLSSLVMRLLSKKPADRPQSAGEVAAGLAKLQQQPQDQVVPTSVNLDIQVQPRASKKPSRRRAKKTEANAPKPEPQTWPAGLFRNRNLLMVGGGVLAALLMLGAILFRFPGKDGTVVVELEGDPKITAVEIDGRAVSFTPAGTDKQVIFKVEPGSHTLSIKTQDGLELITDLGERPLEIKAGGNATLRAWVEQASVPIVPREPNYAAERDVATWILANKGDRSIEIQVGTEPEFKVKDVAALPDGPFRVRSVSSTHVQWLPDIGQQLSKLSALTHVRLFYAGLDDEHLNGLETSRTLQYLTLNGASISDDTLRTLCEGLSTLEHLGLNFGENMTGDSLKAISVLPNLEWLDIGNRQIDGSGIVEIGKLHRLKTLMMSGVPDAKELTEQLDRLPNLECLSLNGNKWVDDHQLEQLAALPKLSELTLRDTSVTDAGLEFLEGAAQLRLLALNNTAITDRGLSELKQLTMLTTLEISDTNVTEAGVRELQAALPDCKIKSNFGDLMTATEPSAAEPATTKFPRPTYDPSPLPKLGTWEPVGTAEIGKQFPGGRIGTADALPGLAMLPAKLPGIRRWNVETRLRRGKADIAKFSPDDKLLAVGSADGHVRIYDAETLELKQLLPGLSDDHGVANLDWHPDGKRLIANHSNGGRLSIWNVTGELIAEPDCLGYSNAVFSPDGQRLLTASARRAQHQICIRNVDGTVLKKIGAIDSKAAVYGLGALAWSPDSQLFASLHLDNKLRIWSREGELKTEVDGFGSFDKVSYRIQWKPTGEWIGVVDGDRPGEIQRISPTGERGDPLKLSDKKPIHRFQWGSAGKKVYGASTSFLHVLDVAANEATELRPAGNWYAAMAVNHSETRIVSMCNGMKFFDRQVNLVQKVPLSGVPWSCKWNGLGNAFVVADGRHFSRWNSTGNKVSQFGSAHGNCPAIAWHPDGKRIALSTEHLQGIHLGNTEEELEFLNGRKYRSIKWSCDGKFFAGRTSGVDVYDSSGTMLKQIDGTANKGAGFEFHPNLDLLFVGIGQDLYTCSSVDDWRLNSIANHEGVNFSGGLMWSPDGHQLLVVGTGVFDFDGEKFSLAREVPRHTFMAWHPGTARLGTAQGSRIGFLDVAQDGPQVVKAHTAGLAISIDAHPSRDLFTTTHDDSTIISWDADVMEPYWRALLLPEDQSVTITAAGQIMHGDREVVDEHLIYYVENDEGRIEMLTPTEFEKRIGQSLYISEQPEPLVAP